MDDAASLSHFADVDDATDSARFITYLDGVSPLEAVRNYKRQTFAAQRVRQGHHVLDVGCGTGDDLVALRRIVGDGGRVVGVDSSDTLIAEARRRTREAEVRAECEQADARALPFPDASFDGCRADRVLQHVSDPAAALAEMVRVCRPAGVVVVADPDWDTLIADAAHRRVTRRLSEFACDSVVNGAVGRQLRGLAHGARLTDVAVTPHTIVLSDFSIADQVLQLSQLAHGAVAAGRVSSEDCAAWLHDLRASEERGGLFVALTGFVVSGRKP